MWGQQGPQKVAQAVGSCNSHADTQRGDTLTVQHVSILTPQHNQALLLCLGGSSIYHSTALLIRQQLTHTNLWGMLQSQKV